jgi:hypothetical protein
MGNELKDLIQKYRHIVMSYEGNDFIYPDEWTDEEKALLIELKMWPVPEDYHEGAKKTPG